MIGATLIGLAKLAVAWDLLRWLRWRWCRVGAHLRPGPVLGTESSLKVAARRDVELENRVLTSSRSAGGHSHQTAATCTATCTGFFVIFVLELCKNTKMLSLDPRDQMSHLHLSRRAAVATVLDPQGQPTWVCCSTAAICHKYISTIVAISCNFFCCIFSFFT